MSSDAPLSGRRFYFVGIGGAGLSAYANFARGWGAEVRGWDARETIFMETLAGVEIDIGGEPAPPHGFEVVVSTAHRSRVEGRPRAELLAELVSLRPSIVVGGAHGKTTTAAMIAFVLRELGHDPAWIVGGVVPQLGGNAGTGSGWLVVEGDESDRSIGLLRPGDRRRHERRARPSRDVRLRGGAPRRSSTSGARGVPKVVRGWELEPVSFALAVPGEHNRRNAACALAALELAEIAARGRRARARRLRGGRAALPARRGAWRRLRSTTTTATTRPRSRPRSQTARDHAERAVIAVYQPHVHERTRHAVPRARRRARDRGRGHRDRGHRRPRRTDSRRRREARARPRAPRRSTRLGADARRRGAARSRVGAPRRRRRDPRRGRAVEDRPRDGRRACRE